MQKALEKIIFVDDDEDTLMIVKFSLKKLPSSISVKFLSSGEATIQEALAWKPDLIFLDVMMPKMDGIATLKAIRLLPTIAHIPIVFVTAKIQKTEVDYYKELGVVDVIVKPFDPVQLPQRILDIWEKL